MEQPNSQAASIGIGAMVEATDGLVGNVTGVETDPSSGQVTFLIVENDNQDKQFTIPAKLIARQTGTQVIHLNIARDQLLNSGVEMEVDTNTGNIGHPNLPVES